MDLKINNFGTNFGLILGTILELKIAPEGNQKWDQFWNPLPAHLRGPGVAILRIKQEWWNCYGYWNYSRVIRHLWLIIRDPGTLHREWVALSIHLRGHPLVRECSQPPWSLNPNLGTLAWSPYNMYMHEVVRCHFGERCLGCHLRPALPRRLFPMQVVISRT